MKQQISDLLRAALERLVEADALDLSGLPRPAREPQVDRTKDQAHGDFATNLALVLAKPLGGRPRDLAERLVALLPQSEAIERVEIAGPGFINFFVGMDAYRALVPEILSAGHDYGLSLIHISEPTRLNSTSRMPSYA